MKKYTNVVDFTVKQVTSYVFSYSDLRVFFCQKAESIKIRWLETCPLAGYHSANSLANSFS